MPTHPLAPQDQDLDWVCKRRTDAAPPAVQAAAAHIAARTARHAHQLHLPDAWFHLKSHRLQFTDPGPGLGYVGLCPGDSLHSNNVMRIAYLYHDMVYVGLGYMVSFNRIDSWLGGEVSLDRVDEFEWAAGCKILTNDFPRYMARDRVVRRALDTLGYYAYDPVRFNCQHVFHAIMGAQPHAIGVEQTLALTFGCMVVLVVVIVLIAMACIRLRKRAVKPASSGRRPAH